MGGATAERQPGGKANETARGPVSTSSIAHAPTRVEEVLSQLCDSLQVGDIRLSVLNLPPGGTTVRRASTSAIQFAELLIPIGSALVVRAGEEELVVRRDEVLYLVARDGYIAYAPHQCFAISVRVPLVMVKEYLGSLGEVGLLRGSALLKAIKAFLIGLLEPRDGELGRLPDYFAEKLVWEMVVSLLLESRGVGDSTRPGLGPLDRALAHIAAHRADPALRPVALAQALNISTRQLQRTFSAVGKTPSGEIRRQRADLALSLLQDTAYDRLTVNQVAYYSGFADAAELRRAFHVLGYPAPSRARARPGERRSDAAHAT